MIVSHEILITQLGGHSDFLCHTLSSTYSFFLFLVSVFWDGFVSISLCFLLLDWKVVIVFLIFVPGTSGYGYRLYCHEEPGRYGNNWMLILSVRGNYYLHDAFCTYCSVSSGV